MDKKVTFAWDCRSGWPCFYINGERYRGLISGRVYDRTVCRFMYGEIQITRKQLFAED